MQPGVAKLIHTKRTYRLTKPFLESYCLPCNLGGYCCLGCRGTGSTDRRRQAGLPPFKLVASGPTDLIRAMQDDEGVTGVFKRNPRLPAKTAFAFGDTEVARTLIVMTRGKS